MKFLNSFARLCRPIISLFSACSTATGYLLAGGHAPAQAIMPASAIFLMACGASALNQCQERSIDAVMARTRERPLPQGTITLSLGLMISFLLIAAGMIILVRSAGIPALMLGILALFWYNGVYTYLKRVTALASIAGAGVGMLPPVIGWVSAGGALTDARLGVLCFIFFLWQVPHFWILLISHAKEYQQAGLPSIISILNRTQASRLTYVWISATIAATMLLPLFGMARTWFIYLPLAVVALQTLWQTRTLLSADRAASPPMLFATINGFIMAMMFLLALERVLARNV